jgi:hypothetical protein
VIKPVTTLTKLAHLHAPDVIDFLKVDVEGHEAEVLAGNDWMKIRPKVVLIEAIEPITNEDASYRFEPFLLDQDYEFAFNDNLNRWYVAREQAGLLLTRFPKAPVEWNCVKHLGEYGPAHLDTNHPDHSLAKTILAHFLAKLPGLDAEQLRALGASDVNPAALARIASLYDGGYIVDQV